jgi:hypothetical protein
VTEQGSLLHDQEVSLLCLCEHQHQYAHVSEVLGCAAQRLICLAGIDMVCTAQAVIPAVALLNNLFLLSGARPAAG